MQSSGGLQFFGSALVDRVNKLSPAHQTTSLIFHDATIAADFVNQWTIFNTSFIGGANVNTVSLGGFVTAPDNSSTGQKIIEATNNGVHQVQSAICSRGATPLLPWSLERIAVVLQYAGRRIALRISENTAVAGVVTVFDLANGQIGVAGTVFGSIGQQDPNGFGYRWTAVADHITALGGGWYLCAVDFVAGFNGGTNITNSTGLNLGSGLLVTMLLDAGSGTAAQNTSYTGDGSSGVNVWRSSLLPVRAYALNRQSFFDDFTSLSTIDMANSKNQGFNWYIDRRYTEFNAGIADTSQFSIVTYGGSNSVFKIAIPDAIPTVASFAQVIPSTFGSPIVGTLDKLPMLAECRAAYDYNSPVLSNQPASYWTGSVELLVSPQPGGGLGQKAVEVDYFESIAGGSSSYLPSTTDAGVRGPGINSGSGSHEGAWSSVPLDTAPLWSSTGLITYNVGYLVWFNGVLYQCIQAHVSPPAKQPDISPTFWSTYSQTPVPVVVDFTALNIWSTLWIPYVGKNDLGQIVTFFNGIMVSGITYGPDILTNQGSRFTHYGDNLGYPRLWGGMGYTVWLDWVSTFTLPGPSLSAITVLDKAGTSRSTQSFDQSNVGTGPWTGARELHDGIAGTLVATLSTGLNLAVDGSAQQPIRKDAPSATSVQTSVASSASIVNLLPRNANRLGASIYNDSTQILYLLLADFQVQAVSTTVYTVQMPPQSRYDVPANYTTDVQGIWASANGFARVTELTS